MKDFGGGIVVGALVIIVWATYYWPNTKEFKLGQEVQKVLDVCEEKLPRNEKCTFLIISERDAPEGKLIYDEEKSDE